MDLILSLLLSCAAYAASTRDATRILCQCDIANDKHGIAAFTSEGELIGSACATRLGKSDSQSIAIDVNHTPPYLGNITVGESSFQIHSNPSGASQPVCNRIYNEHELEIDMAKSREAKVEAFVVAVSCRVETFEHNACEVLIDQLLNWLSGDMFASRLARLATGAGRRRGARAAGMRLSTRMCTVS